MYQDLKRFSKHSLIYFIGNLLNRLGVLLLLPVYTNYLNPGEYGTLEIIFVTIAFVRVFLGMRLGHAILRFFFEYENEGDRKSLVSTSLISIMIWSALLIFVLMSLSKPLSKLIFETELYKDLLILGFSVMFFEVTSEIPIAFFRAKEYSILYVVVSFLQLILRLILNIYMVIYMQMGIKGVLIGNLLSSILFWSILFGITIRYSGVVFDYPKLKSLFRYSYPLVIASIPGVVLVNADRFFLNSYSTLEVVGLYALALRFGMILQIMISEPFQTSYGPFRFSIMKYANAKELYSRILTYYLYGVTITGLVITLLSKEVIEVMASHVYLEAYKVVPIISIAIILRGVTYVVQTGILLEKRTDYMPYINGTSALFHLSILFILVPRLTLYGAAFAVLITQILELVLMYHFSQKLYPLVFEYQRLIKILILGILIYVMSVLLGEMNLFMRVFIKVGLIGLFPFVLIPLKFYKEEEVEKISAARNLVTLKISSIFSYSK